MTDEKKQKPFQGIDHGTKKIDLGHLFKGNKSTYIGRPTEIHHKADGAIGDKPSFCIVMVGHTAVMAGEISLNMLNDGLNDIGYEIVCKDKPNTSDNHG